MLSAQNEVKKILSEKENTIQMGIQFWETPINTFVSELFDAYTISGHQPGIIKSYARLLERLDHVTPDEVTALGYIIVEIEKLYLNDQPLTMADYLLLAKGYKYGIGVKQDNDELQNIYILAQAEDVNDPNLNYELGNYKHAAKQDSALAYLELGKQLLQEHAIQVNTITPSIDQNELRTALKYNHYAAPSNEHIIDNKLETQSSDEEEKVNEKIKIPEIAIIYFKKAAQLGCAEAFTYLAKIEQIINNEHYRELAAKEGNLESLILLIIRYNHKNFPCHLSERCLNKAKKNIQPWIFFMVKMCDAGQDRICSFEMNVELLRKQSETYAQQAATLIANLQTQTGKKTLFMDNLRNEPYYIITSQIQNHFAVNRRYLNKLYELIMSRQSSSANLQVLYSSVYQYLVVNQAVYSTYENVFFYHACDGNIQFHWREFAGLDPSSPDADKKNDMNEKLKKSKNKFHSLAKEIILLLIKFTSDMPQYFSKCCIQYDNDKIDFTVESLKTSINQHLLPLTEQLLLLRDYPKINRIHPRDNGESDFSYAGIMKEHKSWKPLSDLLSDLVEPLVSEVELENDDADDGYHQDSSGEMKKIKAILDKNLPEAKQIVNDKTKKFIDKIYTYLQAELSAHIQDGIDKFKHTQGLSQLISRYVIGGDAGLFSPARSISTQPGSTPVTQLKLI